MTDNSMEMLASEIAKHADEECWRRLIALAETIKATLLDLTGQSVTYEPTNYMPPDLAHFHDHNPLMEFVKSQGFRGESGNCWHEIALLHRAKYIREFVKKRAAETTDEVMG